MSTIGRQFEPGDYVAWYLGLVQYRGYVQQVLGQSDELVVISTSGVRHWVAPAYQQVDLLGPLPTDNEWMGAIR